MTTLKGLVGNGKMNDPAHVAVLQMCLKVLKVLKGDGDVRRGDSYYAGDIDGVFSDELIEAVKEAVHDGRLGARSAVMLNYVTERHTSKLLPQLPAPYRGLDYQVFRDSPGVKMIAISPSASNASWGYRPSELAMKNEDATALVNIAGRLANIFSVVTYVDELNITHDGMFLVRLKAEGGRVVNKKTAKLEELKGTETAKLANFLLKAGFGAGSDIKKWELVSGPNADLILKSTTAHKELKYSWNARGLLRIKLGYYHDRKQKPAIDKCLEIYELHLIGGTLSDKQKQTLIQCFGASWSNVEQTLAARKIYADDFKDKLRSAISRRERAREGLLATENTLRRKLGIPMRNWPGELAQDVAALITGKAVSRGARAGIKAARGSGKPQSEVEEVATDFITDATSFPLEVAIDPPDDLADKFLLVLGVAGLVLFAFAIPLIAIGGTAAVLGGGLLAAATAANEIAFAGSAIKAGYDAVDGYLYNLGLEEEQKFFRDKVFPAALNLANAVQDLRELLNIVKQDSRFSFADAGFSAAELEAGQRDLEGALERSRELARR